LNVGCGDGRFLYELNQRVSGKGLAGMDCSKRAIEYARTMEPGIQWLHGNINEKGILDAGFNITTLIEVPEHIVPDDIPSFLEGIDKHLDSDGAFRRFRGGSAAPKNITSASNRERWDCLTLTFTRRRDRPTEAGALSA
jgi:cyclopropane fatty-acyl-phospholipid synthase-like methyltransferase